MQELIPLFKSIHIFGFVAWFAGLFYLVRMFVYHREAFDKAEPARSILIEQHHLMEWRVYKIIMTPAMVLTWTCGTIMIFIYGWEWFTLNIWLHWKIGLLILLTGYHHYCKGIIKKLDQGKAVMTSFQFRLFNELPTIFLLSIVLLAVYQSRIDFLKAFGGIMAFGVLLFLGAKMYKKARQKGKAI